ncbi:MAG: ATP-binding protein [Sterolibacterium sp.]|jgi:signal transduction histidine kinase
MDTDKAVEKTRARILLVDDDVGNLSVLGSLLQPHYDVLAAPSGERALQIAAGVPQPDLILLDVLMPGMDGYTVLARLRENIVTRDIPVIFVTELDSAEDEETGLEHGAVDYIAKPYRPPIILARVRTRLELKRARDWLRDQNAYLEAEVARRLKENEGIQRHLLQSDKLAAIGQLAAGVAHEINNPIGFVTSNMGSLEGYVRDMLEILDAYAGIEKLAAAGAANESTGMALAAVRELKQRKDFDFLRDDIPKLIAESQDGLARVTTIVKDLKGFSRADDANWQWADLRSGLESTLNMVWNELKYHCTVHKDYGDLPELWCLPSQLNQVFMNLLVNAGQAIAGKGEINIATGQRGEEVFVAINDTGCGISPEGRRRLFEPFFTTKPEGKGTGLGLSLAFNIVQKHGGRIEVDSTPGKGSTFTVWLPVKPSAASPTTENG